MKEQNTPPASKASGNRPGQRQQERLQRLARRRKRQQKIISVFVAIIIVALAGVGIWQYQQYQQKLSDQAQLASQHATATATTQCNHTVATAQANASGSAPDKPPVVNTQPVTLSDGLQYIDVQAGCGDPAASGNTLSVIYTGWLQSTGQKFDSTYDDGGQPFSVALGQGKVIPGWEEGLVGVKAGGTRRLIIPGALAYGEQGSNQGKVPIPPNATLIFDVMVVSIQ
jgi:FKBP-type peptidyl-prolyl cis-trans isomerase